LLDLEYDDPMGSRRQIRLFLAGNTIKNGHDKKDSQNRYDDGKNKFASVHVNNVYA
jgi:hypothetical protein